MVCSLEEGLTGARRGEGRGQSCGWFNAEGSKRGQARLSPAANGDEMSADDGAGTRECKPGLERAERRSRRTYIHVPKCM